MRTASVATCQQQVRVYHALLWCVLFLTPLQAGAQTNTLSASDLQLVRDTQVRQDGPVDRHVHYGFGNKRQRFNPIYHVLSSSMYLYQRCISPVISRSCAFAPSCSGYSKALIAEYGLAKGVICSADRLMRCNRISLADPITYSLIDIHDGHIHESVDRYRLR